MKSAQTSCVNMETHDTDYTTNCKVILCDSSGNDELMQILNDVGCLEDFVGMVQLLRCGKMSPKILDFQLCMGVSRFQNCKTTTAMRFRYDTEQFWEVVLRIGHSKMIQLCSRSKNQGA